MIRKQIDKTRERDKNLCSTCQSFEAVICPETIDVNQLGYFLNLLSLKTKLSHTYLHTSVAALDFKAFANTSQ